MAFWLWIALAIVTVLVVLGLGSRLSVRIRYSRSGRLDQLVIFFQALNGLFHYQIILPSIVIRGWQVVYREKRQGGLSGQDKAQGNERAVGRRTIARYSRAYRTLLASTRKFRLWARRTLKKVECTRWRLDFRIGTGDAASTAMIAGLLWAVSGCATGMASRIVNFRTSPHGEVKPNYSAAEFAVVWEADFHIRVITALWALARLGTSTIRIRSAIRAWRSWMTPPGETAG
ncbi:DUF2953 domain-containing protein [Cohnella boryungensis]|uniref:DUF2953 domain-containing protein n=1 Tax=Cohnella boryungensis TaxID=768479 RepID=A0ABV8S6K2_9BACL